MSYKGALNVSITIIIATKVIKKTKVRDKNLPNVKFDFLWYFTRAEVLLVFWVKFLSKFTLDFFVFSGIFWTYFFLSKDEVFLVNIGFLYDSFLLSY